MSLELVLEHLYLVVISCVAVIAVGIPLGIFTYYHARVGKIVDVYKRQCLRKTPHES